MDKKYWKYILIGLAILVFALLSIAAFGMGQHGKITDFINPVKPPKDPLPPPVVPAGSSAHTTTTNWIKERFPLDYGMYGEKIRLMQRALGIKDDGYFGNDTWAAVGGQGILVPVQESEYNEIIYKPSTGTTTTTPSGHTASTADIGKTAVANEYVAVFKNDGKKSFEKYVKQGGTIGTVTGLEGSDYIVNNTLLVAQDKVFLLTIPKFS